MELGAVIRDYKQKHRPRAQAELDSFRSEATLEAAIRRAALAMTRGNKRYPHQRRLKMADLKRAEVRLLQRASAIADAANFAQLHELVQTSVGHFAGLGPLYVYDTTLRIGAKRGKLPTRIYLHAGTREGVRKLGIDIKGRKVLDRFELPPPLQELELHEIEDVLCIYKNLLGADAGGLDGVAACWPEDDDDTASSPVGGSAHQAAGRNVPERSSAAVVLTQSSRVDSFSTPRWLVTGSLARVRDWVQSWWRGEQ